jgi:hypothetical protein
LVCPPTRSPSQEPPFSPSTPRLRLSDSAWQPPLLPIVIAALDEREWTYSANEELNLVALGITADHAAYNCAVIVNDDTRLVTMLARASLRVPLEERGPACELLMRANHGLMLGNFDLDFAGGEVRNKVSVDVEGGTLGTRMVQTMISVALDMHEMWYPPLMKVIYGGVTPQDAVAEVHARTAENGDGS